VATLQDSETLSSASARPTLSGGRQRYVVGIFPAHSDARRAVAELASGSGEILVVSASASVSDVAATGASARVTSCQLGGSSAISSDFAAALNASPDFRILGPRNGAAAREAGRLGDMAPHFESLVHHLAAGATVVLVHAGGQEAHLRASRILLDAKCAKLLTHDVTQSERVAELARPADEECCQTCTDRACGKFPSSLA
jgi:hypothetical protein